MSTNCRHYHLHQAPRLVGVLTVVIITSIRLHVLLEYSLSSLSPPSGSMSCWSTTHCHHYHLHQAPCLVGVLTVVIITSIRLHVLLEYYSLSSLSPPSGSMSCWSTHCRHYHLHQAPCLVGVLTVTVSVIIITSIRLHVLLEYSLSSLSPPSGAMSCWSTYCRHYHLHQAPCLVGVLTVVIITSIMLHVLLEYSLSSLSPPSGSMSCWSTHCRHYHLHQAPCLVGVLTVVIITSIRLHVLLELFPFNHNTL